MPMAARQPRPLTLCVASLLLLAACAKERDPVTANQVLGPGDGGAVQQLTPTQETAVLDAMREGTRVGDPEIPTPARYGVRWSDVHQAAIWAASECDMAILRREETADGYRFELLTVRDEPAELLVHRAEPPTIFTASATVGSFGQRPKDAERLVKEFGRFMRAFGKKPGFETPLPSG